MHLNKVQLIGTLGRDPEIRHTNDSKPIANLSVATSERWKDKNGEQQERTEWHRVVVFGGAAGVCEKYLKKGDKAYFEGKLQTRKWTDNSGQEKYTTEIVVDVSGTVILLGGKTESQAKPVEQKQQNEVPFNDDIPF